MTDTYYIIAVSDNGLVVGGKVNNSHWAEAAQLPCDEWPRANDNQGDSNEAKTSAAQNVLGAIMPDIDACELCGGSGDDENSNDDCARCGGTGIEPSKLTAEERLDGYEPTM